MQPTLQSQRAWRARVRAAGQLFTSAQPVNLRAPLDRRRGPGAADQSSGTRRLSFPCPELYGPSPQVTCGFSTALRQDDTSQSQEVTVTEEESLGVNRTAAPLQHPAALLRQLPSLRMSEPRTKRGSPRLGSPFYRSGEGVRLPPNSSFTLFLIPALVYHRQAFLWRKSGHFCPKWAQ